MDPSSEASAYEMKISMSVLEALGINLYSNAAAVMSELVANAWDADANIVSILWNPGEADSAYIDIRDDGRGMTQEDLRQRFLTVGYSKRISEGGSSQWYGRPFMGRKGIGKLSVFSIADIVEVHSASESEINALRINVEDLKGAIQREVAYHPESIPPLEDLGPHGTVIRLSSLKRKRIDVAISALRKRVARRFDVLTLSHPDPTSDSDATLDGIEAEIMELREGWELDRAEGEVDSSSAKELADRFYVAINGTPISFDDRAELRNLEYLWEFGEHCLPAEHLSPDIHRTIVSSTVDSDKGWRVSGWFGTARRPDDLTEDKDAGSLKNIIVLSRGRPIQEGILEKLDFSRLFVSYVTGQIRADFLDVDDDDDIATSDRQRLMEDDPRVVALRNFLRAALLKASDEWSQLRPQQKAKELLKNNEVIREWISSLPEYQRPLATKLMGTIASVSIPEGVDGASARRDLFKSGIIAFEHIGLRQSITGLEQLASLEAGDILSVLATLDSYESAMYLNIVKARVETIQSFELDVAENVLEKVLQQNLHSNLWLLDPAWDRISQDATMEERIFEMAEALGAERPDEDALKRIDLRYCNVQNRHVIVELKRPSVKPDIDNLYDQGHTYVTALTEVLAQTGRSDEPFEVIFVVGNKPTAKKAPPKKLLEDYSRERVAEINGRVFLYSELVHSARAQYREYLERNQGVSRVAKVLEALDGEGVDESAAVEPGEEVADPGQA